MPLGSSFYYAVFAKARLNARKVNTILGPGLSAFCRESGVESGHRLEKSGRKIVQRERALRPNRPFKSNGRHFSSSKLGRSVIKISAVEPEHWAIEAPAIVFQSQAFCRPFKVNELNRDFIAVLPFQGPGSNGMPSCINLRLP